MTSIENAAEMEKVASDRHSTDDKKEEVSRNMDSFQEWVTMGSAWFRSAKEKVTFRSFDFIHIAIISIPLGKNKMSTTICADYPIFIFMQFYGELRKYFLP